MDQTVANPLGRLHDVIAGGEEWITDRVISYAKLRGYTPFTSTLEEAWRASVRGLSQPLLSALADGRSLTEVSAEADYSRDPIACYGIEAARRHRTRGITLGLFLGLMKSYRRAYLDLAFSTEATDAEREAWYEVIDNFFDRMEVGFSDEWAAKPADLQLDQLRAQNRLITNEKNKYLTIFESLNDPVFLVGEAGGIENMNHAALELFGLTKVPGAGYYGNERVDLSALLGFDAAVERNLACEREIDTKRGRRWFDVRAQPMLDVSEKYLGTVVILVDVTEYRKAKIAAEAASRAKSSFLAAMSHEIRTPIHGILGLADLLAHRPLPVEDRRLVEAIGRSGELLSSIVSDILDYSKIEAGVFEREHVEFCARTMVEDVVAIMRPLAARKPGLDLVLRQTELPMVLGDQAKVKQILINLIGNAIKFTETGTVSLAASAHRNDETQATLIFEVADTGIGISADRHAEIFEPFTQSDASITRRYGGTGLGLSICRVLAGRLGGSIALASEPGAGSRFTVSIPFELADATDSGPCRPRGRSAPASPLDVLVVEDNEVNALVALGMLERSGHRAAVAASGQAALDLAGSRAFDLILMDLRLPDMDGREITRRIRALADPARAGVPVVAMSAQLLPGDVTTCLQAGMTDFLSKPFRSEQLDDLLRRSARKRKAPDKKPANRRAGPDTRPAASTGGAPQLVDLSILEGHVRALGIEQVERIVAAWRGEARSVRTRLQEASSSDDRAAIAGIAHALKSAAHHVGLVALSRAAADLDRTARAATAPVAAEVTAFLDLGARSSAALESAWTAMARRQPAKT